MYKTKTSYCVSSVAVGPYYYNHGTVLDDSVYDTQHTTLENYGIGTLAKIGHWHWQPEWW